MALTQKISIILATYNRSAIISKNIEKIIQYYKTLLQLGLLEVLVIDNNSADDTKEVVISFSAYYESIKYFLETKQGLSHSRNRGIQEASGEILIFLDDDVEVASNWLYGLVNPLIADPSVGVVGGRVVPFGQDTPAWIPEKYYWIVGVIDYGMTPKFVGYAPGGNMALRKALFDELDGFDPTLGRNGALALGGEEVELQRRIKQKGLKIYYSPEGLIYHKIADKLNEEYILRFAYHEGLSCKRMDQKALKLKYLTKSAFAVAMTRVVLPFRRAFAQTLETSIRQRYLQGYLVQD